MASKAGTDGPEPMIIDTVPSKLQLSISEEDPLASKRVENTDRNFRRISTKFHTYAAALQDQQKRRSGIDPGYPAPTIPLEDLREGVRQELDAFLLSVQKSGLVVQAEQMQVQEYHDNRIQILNEHDSIRAEIEKLRMELQDAELQKERKKEYDVIAARVNTLPQRSELNAAIAELEDEIGSIMAEQEATREILTVKRSIMEDIRYRIQEMILHGRDTELEDSESHSTPNPSSENDNAPLVENAPLTHQAGVASTSLNPDAKPITPSLRPPSSSTVAHRLLRSSAGSRQPSPLGSLGASSPIPEDGSSAMVEEPEDGEDIEMGEVSEIVIKDSPASKANGHGPDKSKRDRRKAEELEEGEASDSSSALSSTQD